ncbi:MAG: 3-isopropylmalate dehydratase, partial [Planctomycetes bacterium]|nr:3-isopropylmalate dehydratase [Planctomycetota bacterium]
MEMTITEKILARHAGRADVEVGENIWIDVDVLMTHDICGPGTIGIFEEHFGVDGKVFDAEKVVIVPDHYIFTAEPKARRNVEILRKFAAQQSLKYYYDPDFMIAGEQGCPSPYADASRTSYRGVCHVALPQMGHTRPGEVLLGTDSHTCTHGAFGEFATGVGNTEGAFVMGTGRIWLKVPPSMKFVLSGELPPYVMGKDIILQIIGAISVDGARYCAMEFAGDTIGLLGVDERCTICNMAVEAGAKNGIIAADDVTLKYVRQRNAGAEDVQAVTSDANARYASVMQIDAAALEPTVAQPHSPDNRALARELTDVKVDRVYIGSCTGGKTTDLVAAAGVLGGKTVRAETFVVPATVEVDMDLDRRKIDGKTLRQIFVDAGCNVGPASCAACLGGPQDTFGRANEA